MTMSGSVTGPDRRPGNETAKRPGGRREEGGSDFETALSAEVGRPGDEKERGGPPSVRRTGMTDPRAVADRTVATRSTTRRETTSAEVTSRAASREAASRAAESRDAASRAAAERAAISRAASARAADRADRAADRAERAAADSRTEQRADRAALERRTRAARSERRAADRPASHRDTPEQNDAVRNENPRPTKRPAVSSGTVVQRPAGAPVEESDRVTAPVEESSHGTAESAPEDTLQQQEKPSADAAATVLSGLMVPVPTAPVPTDTRTDTATTTITGTAPPSATGDGAIAAGQTTPQSAAVPMIPAGASATAVQDAGQAVEASTAAAPPATAPPATAPPATPAAPTDSPDATGQATPVTTPAVPTGNAAPAPAATPVTTDGPVAATAAGPTIAPEIVATLRPESLRGVTATPEAVALADTEPTATLTAPDPATSAVPQGDRAPGTGTGAGSQGQGDRSGQGGPGTGADLPATAGRTTPEGAAVFSAALPPAAGQAETGLPAAPAAGPAGVTAAQATAPAAPAANAPPAPPANPPAPPAAQLATRIIPLRLDADGVHRMTVNLHPADLGPVQVVAEIRNGDISVQLTGGTEAGTTALRQGLDDLRRELEGSGFGNCSLDLRQGTAQHGRQQPGEVAGRRADGGDRGGPDVGAEPAPTATRRVDPASGRLDVRA